MKKTLLILTIFIFACSSDDSSDTNNDDNNNSATVTDIDGNTYDYLTFCNQYWTVTNAEMVTYRDGTPIPHVTNETQWSELTTGAWCYYDNDPTKGKLYNWYAVMGIHDTDPSTPNKEFAPEGWHVPSDNEWTTLENCLIAGGYNFDGTTTENKIAKSMASNTGWNTSTQAGAVGNDQSLNNSSGFNAFPVGYRFYNGLFASWGHEGDVAYFWGSTGGVVSGGHCRYLFNDGYKLYNAGTINRRMGLIVRFVRD